MSDERYQQLERPDVVRPQVGAKAARKLKAQRHSTRTVWFGLGMMGLIGWSVVVPTLFGAALGIWLDKHYPGSHSWTLMLLAIGLASVALMRGIGWPRKTGKYASEEENNHE